MISLRLLLKRNPEVTEKSLDNDLFLMTGLHKWTSDSELYKAEADEEEANWKTLQLKNRAPASGQENTDATGAHPLRRSRAQIRLVEEIPSNSVRINYSQHEMEDWILRSSSDEMLHRHFSRTEDDDEGTTDTTASAIHSGDEEASACGDDGPSDILDVLDEDALFGRQLSSPECGNPVEPCQVTCSIPHNSGSEINRVNDLGRNRPTSSRMTPRTAWPEAVRTCVARTWRRNSRAISTA